MTPELPPRDDLADDDIGPALGVLIASYPGFRFCYARIGWNGRRWIAERVSGLEPGLHTAITPDLGELHAALRQDRERHAR